MGLEVRFETIAREMLYIAEEVFMTGTAAEITPIRSVDRVKVGAGKPGPITQRLQDAFFAITSGRAEDKHGWLTYV
jgi:branched-chain amino acid aminotransferase